MTIYRNLALVTVIALAGCASNNEPKWAKDGAISQGNAFVIADSQCTAEAYKAPVDTLSDCIAVRSPISRGACRGAAEKRSKNLRDKIYDGCMLNKGWKKQLSE